MKPPVRLLESSESGAARQLLRAGVAEPVPRRARHATAAALGISATVAGAAGTATAAAAGALPASGLASQSLALLGAKWVAVGALGGIALGGGASVVENLVSKREVVVTSAALSTTSALAPARPSAPPVRPIAAEKEPPRPEARDVTKLALEPAAPGAVRRSKEAALDAARERPPSAPASAALPPAQSLSREIAMIDGARRALASGDSRAALRKLDDYAAVVRTGTLDREADVLRIDALTQSGQSGAAAVLARRYLASYPNDPHAARLRALVDER